MRTYISAGLTICLCLLQGCATTPSPPLPDAVQSLNPRNNCEHESQGGYGIRAQLIEIDGISYLAAYVDPGFSMVTEPGVQMNVSVAIYEGQRDHTYFYRLGKLAKTKRIGILQIVTPTRVEAPKSAARREASPEKELMNKVAEFLLERREDSDCLRIKTLQ